MSPSGAELLRQVKSQIDEVDPAEVNELIDEGVAVVDVREVDEFAAGHIPGAKHVPRSYLESRIEAAVPDRATQVILYCASGNRSAYAARTLRDELGYEHVRSMTGGITLWKDRGYEVEVPRSLSAEQRERYSRHLLIPEIGVEGQQRLLDAKVLLLGAGGLGSPAAMYLAAAGVGKIGIVDFDTVDASNLQRQLLHGTKDIGRLKVESAAETLRNLNPDVEVVPISEHLNSETAMRIFAPYDVIVDGTDNFPTRYLANDAAHFLAKPLVHGSILRFEGRLALFDSAKGTGCYRCLFPEPPPPGEVQSCAEAGVFGVLPGIIGSMMAFETIKYLLNIGRPMIGRYLLFEGEDMTFRELKLPHNKACPLCGEHPTVTGLIDYEAWCGTPAMEPSQAQAS